MLDSKEVGENINKVISSQSDDPWHLACLVKLSPEDIILEELNEDFKSALIEYDIALTDYLTDIASRRPYLDIDAQKEVYWQSPMEPRFELRRRGL